MIDGFDTLVVSFIAPALAQDWSLSPPGIGSIFGIGLAGAALGGFAIGPAADWFGRKRLLIACVTGFALFTLLCARASGPGEMMIYRFLGGLGLGGAIPNITALTAEHTSSERQSSVVTYMFVGFPLGAAIGGAITAAMLEDHGWRSAFWLGGLLPLFVVPAIVFGIPETLGRDNSHGTSGRFTLVGQLAEGRLAASLFLWLGAFFIMLVSYFLVNWTPSVLRLAGFSEARAVMGAVLLNLGGVVGALALTRAVDRFGPFLPVAVALAVGALSIVLLGRGDWGQEAILAFSFVTGCFVLGGQLNIPAMAARLFPTRVRGAGVGWTMGMGRLGSIAGPTVGGALLGTELGWQSLFAMVAAPAVASAVCIAAADRLRPCQALK